MSQQKFSPEVPNTGIAILQVNVALCNFAYKPDTQHRVKLRGSTTLKSEPVSLG